MKRALGLIFIYIAEICFGIIYYVKDVWNKLIVSAPFLKDISEFLRSILNLVKGWINFDFFNNLPNLAKNIIIIIIFNIVFTIVYLIIFGIITYFLKKSKKKKMAQERKRVFVLSDEEKARFDWKLYEKRFPGRRLLSLLIPLFLIFICIVVRYDIKFCKSYDPYNDGYFNIFSSTFLPYLGGFGEWCEKVTASYIDFNSKVVRKIGVVWFEWVEIGIGTIIVLLLWYGFFSIFAKPFRRHRAKVRARKVRRKYVDKMESLEYKAWKKTQKENQVSKKNRDLYDNDENLIENVESDVKTIVLEKETEEKKINSIDNVTQQNYIDDISTGVTDLGVIEEENNEIQEPLINRETHFVGDEDVDIVLEEEPVVETIEDEEDFYNNNDNLVEETFDRYQSDTMLVLNLDDKIKKYNIEVIDEDGKIERFVDNDAPEIKDFEEVADERVLYETENVEKEKNIDNETTKLEIVTEEVKQEENNQIQDEVKQKEIEQKQTEITETKQEENEQNNLDIVEDQIINSDENIETEKTVVIKESPKKVKVVNIKLIDPSEENRDRSKIIDYIVTTSKEQTIKLKDNSINEPVVTDEKKEFDGKIRRIKHKKQIKKDIKPVKPISVKNK